MSIIRVCALAITLLFAIAPAAIASTGEPVKKIRIDQENLAKLSPADQDRVLCIAERMEAIAGIDRSGLTRAERKVLRSELRDLKREADVFNQGGTVLYISAGTLIIILLIILILT